MPDVINLADRRHPDDDGEGGCTTLVLGDGRTATFGPALDVNGRPGVHLWHTAAGVEQPGVTFPAGAFGSLIAAVVDAQLAAIAAAGRRSPR